MANCYGNTKSNDFKVTDVDAFNKLCEGLSAEDEIYVEADKETGVCSVACYGSLDFYNEANDEYEIDEFYNRLSEIIAPGEKAIFVEVGNEKLRYVGGGAYVVTTGQVEYVDLESAALAKGDEMLISESKNKEYSDVLLNELKDSNSDILGEALITYTVYDDEDVWAGQADELKNIINSCTTDAEVKIVDKMLMLFTNRNLQELSEIADSIQTALENEIDEELGD